MKKIPYFAWDVKAQFGSAGKKTYLLLLISVKRPQSFANVLARAHVIALQKITVPPVQSKISKKYSVCTHLPILFLMFTQS